MCGLKMRWREHLEVEVEVLMVRCLRMRFARLALLKTLPGRRWVLMVVLTEVQGVVVGPLIAGEAVLEQKQSVEVEVQLAEWERTTEEAEEELGVRLERTLFVLWKKGVEVLCFPEQAEAIAVVEFPERSLNATKLGKTVCGKVLEVVCEAVPGAWQRRQKPEAEVVVASWELQGRGVLS